MTCDTVFLITNIFDGIHEEILKRIEICGHTLVPWTMFSTPSGKPASAANSARIIEAPKKQERKMRNTEK